MGLYSAGLRTFVLPFLLKRDNRQEALRYYDFLEKSQYWPKEMLVEYQLSKIRELLDYSYRNSRYYKNLFDRLGAKPEEIKNFDDFARLPILTRDHLFEHRLDILSREYDIASVQEVLTGGTTGQQAILHRSYDSYNIKAALAWRHESWMGRRPCDKMAFFWPAHVDLYDAGSWKTRFKRRYLEREVMYYSGTFAPEIMMRFYNDVTRFRPSYFKVFPNALYGFAQFLMERKLRPLKLKGILSTGEPLFENQRRLFEELFQCRVFDMYGSREVGNTASECPAHEGLHIAMETSYVEFVRDGRAVAPGEEGEILITDLTNFAFPMIRYRINDYGVPLDRSCSCGRHLSLMSPGIGRLFDDILRPDGVKMSGNLLGYHLTTDHEIHIGQMQIVQESLTDFKVLITDRPEPNQKVFEFIRNKMALILGDRIRVDIEVVREIPREKSGKMRYVVSKIASTRT